MIDVGDRAPDFSGRASDGSEVRLADRRGQRVVLYFFPKAFTTG
jgi:peroxiredoxin Q/BCP